MGLFFIQSKLTLKLPDQLMEKLFYNKHLTQLAKTLRDKISKKLYYYIFLVDSQKKSFSQNKNQILCSKQFSKKLRRILEFSSFLRT